MDWYYEMKKFDEDYFGAQTQNAERQSSGSVPIEPSAQNDIKRIRKIAEEHAAVGSEERLLDESNANELKKQLNQAQKDISKITKSLLGTGPYTYRSTLSK